MALLEAMRQTFATYVSPQKHEATRRPLTPPISEDSQDQDVVDIRRDSRNVDTNLTLDGDTLLERATSARKRPLSTKTSSDPARKRHKGINYGHSPDDASDSDFEGLTLETSTPPLARTKGRPATSKRAADRVLMPPPASPSAPNRTFTSPRKRTDTGLKDYKVHEEDYDGLSDEETFTNNTAIKRNGPKEVLFWEKDKALRHAEMSHLPEIGATWTEAEQDLFHHLAFRGFEPLVPGNWTEDFNTLPETLFSVAGGDPPLIEAHLQREFRAIDALRKLFTMGSRIRDRALSRDRLPTEPVMARALRDYVSWALADVGVHPKQRPNAIPVHVIAALKRGQTTQDTITTISDKLHSLAQRYQSVYGIQPSIESRDSASTSSASNSETTNPNLPTLIGFMICSSLVVVVTLNSATSSSSTPLELHNDRHASPAASVTNNNTTGSKNEANLRFIATFDFSEDGMDVWNALAMAICVMRVRKTMLELCERGEINGEHAKGGLWERALVKGDKLTTSDDPDL